MAIAAQSELIFETDADFQTGDLTLLDVRGVEAMSTPYELELTLECARDGGISPEGVDDLLKQPARIGFGPGGTRQIAGVIREIELSQMEPSGARSVYRAVLAPRFWLTTLTRRSRCFNNISVPDIIRAVLSDLEWQEGTDFELRTVGDYPKREYVVQYEESDFAFLSRWMELLGLFYFFEQTDGVDKLVITDSNKELLEAPENASPTYTAQWTVEAVGPVHAIRFIARRRPQRLALRDYNWRESAKYIHGETDVDKDHGAGLQALYGQHVKNNDEAEARAKIRAEEWMAGKRRYFARSANYDYAPGCRFTLTGAPVGELDIEYVIIRVDHEITTGGAGTYTNRFEAVPFSVQFRPASRTPWPRIEGVMHARIDAEVIDAGAPIDENGHYTVVMPYDVYGQYGGKATRRIRKAEPYSGPHYGMHFTLHVGAEVILAHVDGDPDRPVIVGSTPSGSTPSPLTKDNNTRSAIRTRSGILIDFEDNA